MVLLGVIVFGLVQGCLAGINSMGFVLLWRTTRIVNLAQPAMGLVGGVLTGLLVRQAGWSFWWALAPGLLMGAALGFAADRVVLARLQDAPRAVLLVATVGLGLVFGAIQSALPFAFDPNVERGLPTYYIESRFGFDIGGYAILIPHVLAVIAMPLALVGLHLFLTRNRFGLAALALGQDAERARALGVPASVVRAIAWTVAGVLATVSGILAIPISGYSLGGGIAPTVLLLALTPAVLAGFRSMPLTAAAALGLGVAYQVCIYVTSRAGFGDLLLALAVVAAIAVRRRRFGRAAAATRASSWEAAVTPRPLPAAITERVASTKPVAAIAVALIVATVPRFLSPSRAVLFATAAAQALCVLAIAVAWMFTGEVSLGHWGFAGFGAAVAAVVPGPWPLRCAVATIALTFAGAVLGLATRQATGLSFAVVGLAVAVAAPVALLAVGRRAIPTVGSQVPIGAAAAGIAVAAGWAVSRLRGTAAGARMVAARDDPERAPWLGADVVRSRVVALAMSAGIAGLAGALYLAATPAGLAPGAFDPARSLDLLAIAVIGGIGAPAGALAGAAIYLWARYVLPGPWSLLASGAGVLVVVVALPGGMSKIVERARDVAIGVITRRRPSRSRPTFAPRPVPGVQR